MKDGASAPAWRFDEFQDFGWSGAAEVAAYDATLGIDPARERERLREIGVSASTMLIDFGCGTGALVLEAAKLCKRVIAVDVSAAMLEHVQKEAERLQLRNLNCVQQGFLSYAHNGEAIDVVVTQHALHHLPDFWKVQALTRMAAVLKPGGVLYIRDLVFSFPPSEADAFLEGFLEDHPLRNLFENDFREEYITYSWLFEAMLERTGFEVRKAVYNEQVYAKYICVKR